jgi:rfaE bifunctional protein nucleotidyltransferase chain/domain
MTKRSDRKIYREETLMWWLKFVRVSYPKIVFTNGCFDILHEGHVRFLEEARALGEVLVVAVNSDASVKALKGDGRPVHSEQSRVRVLAALEAVDAVLLMNDVRNMEMLRLVRPLIWAKGGDYTVDTLDADERAVASEVGAQIKILPLTHGHSTTSTIDRIYRNELQSAATASVAFSTDARSAK